MALFTKEKKSSERERLLGQQIKDVRYDSLADAIQGEVSIGSQDSKITKISFPDARELTILSHQGKIIYARDSARPVDLNGFLYWTDLPEKIRTVVTRLADESPLSEALLAPIATQAPDALTVIRQAMLDSTIETLLTAHRLFDSYELIDTELYKNPDVVKQLSSQGIDILKVTDLVEKLSIREEELVKMLELTGISFGDVKLIAHGREVDEVYVPEKRFVYAAAEAEATLQDTAEISGGFRWSSILQRLYELVSKNLVSIEILTSLEALPDDFVVSRPYERIFKLTLDMELKLNELVDSVFEFSGDLELTKKLAKDNEILEARVLEIEDSLIRELASEEYEDFEDLPEDLQVSIRGLILERGEANKKRENILKRLASFILDDIHTTEDDQLRELISLKLAGIDHAVDSVPQAQEEPFESGFHLPEEAPEFNFSDGRIIQDDAGEFTVEHLSLEEAEKLEPEKEEQLDINEMLKLAEDEVKPEVKPVDLTLLQSHLANLEKRRKRG